MTSSTIDGAMMTDDQIAAIKQAAQAAAPQNLVCAESSDQYDEGSHIECPV